MYSNGRHRHRTDGKKITPAAIKEPFERAARRATFWVAALDFVARWRVN
jgi:hypothetical protein